MKDAELKQQIVVYDRHSRSVAVGSGAVIMSCHQRYRAQIILLVAADDARTACCFCASMIFAVKLAALLCGLCLNFY